MKALGFSILTVVLWTPIFSQGLKGHLDPEIGAIRAVADAYISADPARLREAFLPSMNLYTTDEKGSLRTISFAEFLQRVSANSDARQKERQAAIDSIDRTGNVAIVKITTIRPQARVTDYLSLVRINDQWKIVNKSFFAEPLRTSALVPGVPQAASSDRPCSGQDHRRFDFMIGSWHTSDPGTGTVAAAEGDSSVEALLDGCIVHEHRSVSRQGKRLFDGDAFWGYDSTTKRWLLFYMDDMSHMQVYEGREDPGRLAFYRERPDPDGKLILIRIVYAPAGSSRYTQSVERSADHGTTWQPGGVTTYQSKH
jgi:Putative lumazine-binding/Protein of unknown function (DUF1579)